VKTALVIAAHPDDEILGCGGTMARLADEGWEVAVLLLAEGATSRDQSRDRAARGGEISELERAARAAASILGAKSVRLESLPDNRMDGVELLDIVKLVENEMRRVQPARVFTHHLCDVNVDHEIVHRAVLAACRSLPDSRVEELAFFEVPSSTEWRPAGSGTPFVPNLFVDISATLERKCRALEAYACEMRAFPHPRSIQAIRHLAGWRGATIGRAAAEAFVIGRQLR
jgi:LmbE family N-acetylglucosaminyl deacetylase